jgi:hypothetical protein
VLSRRADYTLLERLLLLDEETLCALTLNRFAVILNRPSPLPGFEDIHHEFMAQLQATPLHETSSSSRVDRPLLTGENYRMYFLPSSSTKVCSICFGEQQAYDRLLLEETFPRHLSAAHCNPTRKLSHMPCRDSVASAFSYLMPCLWEGDYQASPHSLGPLARSLTPSGR